MTFEAYLSLFAEIANARRVELTPADLEGAARFSEADFGTVKQNYNCPVYAFTSDLSGSSQWVRVG